jgi:hypothetical protein
MTPSTAKAKLLTMMQAIGGIRGTCDGDVDRIAVGSQPGRDGTDRVG